MSAITWTPEELAGFNRLCDDVSSPSGGVRVIGRLNMRGFTDKHGKEKCDAMWAHLNGLASQPATKEPQ